MADYVTNHATDVIDCAINEIISDGISISEIEMLILRSIADDSKAPQKELSKETGIKIGTAESKKE